MAENHGSQPWNQKGSCTTKRGEWGKKNDWETNLRGSMETVGEQVDSNKQKKEKGGGKTKEKGGEQKVITTRKFPPRGTKVGNHAKKGQERGANTLKKNERRGSKNGCRAVAGGARKRKLYTTQNKHGKQEGKLGRRMGSAPKGRSVKEKTG